MKSNFFSFLNIKSLLFENKTLKQTIFKNTFWLWIAEVIDKTVAFLVAILLARHFGPTIYGQWAFAISFVSLFTILVDFGFNALVVRELAKDKSKSAQYIDNMLFMKVILGLITFGIIFFSVRFFGKDAEILKLVYFLGIYIIINTFTTFFRSIFEASKKMQYETACRAAQSFILLALVVFFALGKYPIFYFSIAYLSATLVASAISLVVIWNYFSKFFYRLDMKICREILRKAWPFALGGMFVVVYFQVDTLMLSTMKTDSAVGWYNTAYTLFSGLLIVPGLLMASIYPELSSSYSSSKETFIKLYKNSLKYMCILSIIIFPIFFIFAKPLILLLYGSLYINAIIIFRILLSAGFFVYMNYVLSNVLYAINKQMVYTGIMFFCLIMNIILNFFLIPKYSYVGASIASVIPQVFLCLLLFICVRKNLQIS